MANIDTEMMMIDIEMIEDQADLFSTVEASIDDPAAKTALHTGIEHLKQRAASLRKHVEGIQKAQQ